LFNATSCYGKEEFEKMEACLKELRELHERYQEKEVRKILAAGLALATKYYGEENELKKMEECLNELRELYEKYQEKEVREELARGLVGAMIYYIKADKFDEIPYENLILLYRLRFDLLKSLEKEGNIKAIENLFVIATKRKIEEIYDNKEDLEGFLNSLKAELGDTEIALLMNEISEELDIRIQRKLRELLSL